MTSLINKNKLRIYLDQLKPSVNNLDDPMVSIHNFIKLCKKYFGIKKNNSIIDKTKGTSVISLIDHNNRHIFSIIFQLYYISKKAISKNDFALL